jgi:hypothetical protein
MTRTSALLEAPLNITFHQPTQLAKAKLRTLFDSDPGYWDPYIASSGNGFTISLQLMHQRYMNLVNDADVAQALAFITQRLFTDPLVIDCTVTKQFVPPAQRMSNGIVSPTQCFFRF